MAAMRASEGSKWQLVDQDGPADASGSSFHGAFCSEKLRDMANNRLRDVDTVIVGNGPSALILSYILHGHIPYYTRPHHDPLLHAKLESRRNLLDLTPDLYAHFLSSLRYSTQALPINTLLDTLIRPNADTEIDPESCVAWRYEPDKAVSHVALGNSRHAGGQWADKPVSASSEIGTLSYAEMLSLPGYSFADHWKAMNGEALPHFLRPTRAQVAAYYEAYPRAVGIAESIQNCVEVSHVSRTADGFYIGSHDIRCKHLVLGSGIFSVNISPPPLLSPLCGVHNITKPLLVIGSGFSAADVIISTPPHRKIIHMFNWKPEERPSPLRGCHHQAYPEYAGIYRQMKLAALSSSKSKPPASPLMKKRNNPFFTHRDWTTVYEGIPNGNIVDIAFVEDFAKVTMRLESDEIIERAVGGIEYVVGRRGSLDYLDDSLRSEVVSPTVGQEDEEEENSASGLISGRTLREKAETDLEVARSVFIIGSLTGDSLVRHAFGACAYAAGKILDAKHEFAEEHNCAAAAAKTEMPTPPRSPVQKGVNSHSRNGSSPRIRPNGVSHHDLHLDRRKLPRAMVLQSAER
ncbi:hypothetical protein MPH_10599 [Macrophomina phaseolina MS6]|uniref:Uncharacterized protein n=1 Tax=Macrophomina phaseolina (strain MS6) TaxID=1126212 RepID=K2RQ07_MACPH|nr:hypothetical protein MPH_10599 [Macrophomina phaseolina MS6]